MEYILLSPAKQNHYFIIIRMFCFSFLLRFVLFSVRIRWPFLSLDAGDDEKNLNLLIDCERRNPFPEFMVLWHLNENDAVESDIEEQINKYFMTIPVGHLSNIVSEREELPVQSLAERKFNIEEEWRCSIRMINDRSDWVLTDDKSISRESVRSISSSMCTRMLSRSRLGLLDYSKKTGVRVPTVQAFAPRFSLTSRESER